MAVTIFTYIGVVTVVYLFVFWLMPRVEGEKMRDETYLEMEYKAYQKQKRRRRTRNERRRGKTRLAFIIAVFVWVVFILVVLTTHAVSSDDEGSTYSNPSKNTPTATVEWINPEYYGRLPGDDVPATERCYMTEEEIQAIYTERYMGTFVATAYCACEKCCGKDPSHPAYGITATGTTATQGRTIAVDPDVIELGSVVTIDDHQYTAEDTGRAIKGNRIDIFFDSHDDALAFGVQEVAVMGAIP